MSENRSFDKHIGEQIKIARKKALKTQQETAENAVLTPSHYGMIDRGDTLPTLYTMYKLWKELGFSVDEIFESYQELEKKQKHKDIE